MSREGPSDRYSLAGSVAVVTGGSRGIGAATARILASAGARVIVTHRDSSDAAGQVVASLPGSGHRAIRASAVDTPALEAAAASVAEVEGGLDILVNNAAMTKVIPHGDMDALDDAFFDAVLATNLRGPFATVRAFRPLLQADGGGLVVNVTSLAARMAMGSNVAYSASKAGLENMTLSLARALAPDIRVLAIAPALVDTELTRDWSPRRRQAEIDRTPLGRLATPDDVARTVLAAATLLGFATGCVLPVDGGRPLG